MRERSTVAQGEDERVSTMEHRDFLRRVEQDPKPRITSSPTTHR